MSDLFDGIRVLCVRLDGMGDLLMTAPAIAGLRASAPDAHIGLLTSPAGAAAARCMNFIDERFVFSAPWTGHSNPADAVACVETIAALQAARFDLALIFSCHGQNVQATALFCHLAGIPRRMAHTRDKSYALLTDAVTDPDTEASYRHEVERHLALVAQLGAHYDGRPILDIGGHLAGTRALLRTLGIGMETRWALVHPGATAASRRYPPQQWSAVIRQLGDAGIRSVVVGNSVDAADLRAIHVAVPEAATIVLEEDESIAELAALVACAPVLLCNDSGPSHIASCLNTPVVCLYALTHPQHTPWGRRRVAPSRDMASRQSASGICTTGYNTCIANVAPEIVAEAACALLDSALDLDHGWPPPPLHLGAG